MRAPGRAQTWVVIMIIRPGKVRGGMALSDWLARRRAVVWVAAVFLGPVLAGLLTLARPQLHENHVTLLLVWPLPSCLPLGCVQSAWLRP